MGSEAEHLPGVLLHDHRPSRCSRARRLHRVHLLLAEHQRRRETFPYQPPATRQPYRGRWPLLAPGRPYLDLRIPDLLPPVNIMAEPTAVADSKHPEPHAHGVAAVHGHGAHHG